MNAGGYTINTYFMCAIVMPQNTYLIGKPPSH